MHVASILALVALAARPQPVEPEPAVDLGAVVQAVLARPEVVADMEPTSVLDASRALPANGVTPSAELIAASEALEAGWIAELAGEPVAVAPLSLEVALRTYLELGLAEPDAPESRAMSAERTAAAILALADVASDITIRMPSDAEYRGLQAALQRYQGIRSAGGFVPVPAAVRKARAQKEHPAVVALRARLHQEDASVGGDSDPLFGDDVLDGLRRARERYQLEPKDGPNGLLDAPLLTALAVPVEERIEVIGHALAALRRSGRYSPDYYVRVNLPEYLGRVVDQGQTVHTFRVVVGSPGGGGFVNATPTLTSAIRTVIFNPDWTVPQRIFRKEMASEFADELPPETDAGAFEAFWESKGYELHGKTEKSRYLRLPSGPKNPLGKVKLLFDNPYSVYLHDTPSKKLFDKARRAFSHGCVRVQKPVDLAEVLLRHDGTWGLALDSKALQNWEFTPIDLAKPVPLFVEYIPVVTDGQGGVRFLWDVYRRFKKPPVKRPATR